MEHSRTFEKELWNILEHSRKSFKVGVVNLSVSCVCDRDRDRDKDRDVNKRYGIKQNTKTS